MIWILHICTAGWVLCGQEVKVEYPNEQSCFAAMAMQGMVGRTDLLNHERAAYAVDAADCLLAELAKEPK